VVDNGRCRVWGGGGGEILWILLKWSDCIKSYEKELIMKTQTLYFGKQ
jgi:hypothetical protein